MIDKRNENKPGNDISDLIPKIERKISEYESLIASSKDIIFRISPTGKINFISSSCYDLLGYSPEEIIGKSFSKFVPQDKIDEYWKSAYRLYNKDNVISFEIELVTKQGDSIPVEITGRVAELHGNRVGQGTIRDIRNRKENEYHLINSEKTFRTIWNHYQDGMRLTDSEGIIVLCNDAYSNLMGVPKDELMGKSFSVIYSSENQQSIVDKYKVNFNQKNLPKFLECIQTLWNNKNLNLEIQFSFFDDLSGNEFLLSRFRDISERKSNELIIQKKGKFLQGIARATNALISDDDESAGFNNALRILGESADTDRVYIYQHKEDAFSGEMYFTPLYEWVTEGIKSQIQDSSLQKISYSRFSSLGFYESFNQTQTLKFLIKELPPEQQTVFIDQDIRSIILVPILVDKTYWGFVGFDECRSDRIWTEDEESILSTMAATIGTVIKRKSINDQLIKKNEELDEAVRKAEKAAKARGEFLALMSHEIRTPMNGVIGMTGLLLETMLTDTQKEYVNTIRLSGEQLLVIINDILDFTKIESEKLELENQPFDLRECIEDSFDLLATKAAEKSLELSYNIDSSVPLAIIGDVTRLRQILTNLLSNAVKFTPIGEIIISVSSETVRNKNYILNFSVKDSGIGIASDRMHRLFQPFSQVDSSTTRSYGGTGLGLVISKRLVELMGGTITVKSEVGTGSEFNFSIKAHSVSSDLRLNLFESDDELKNKSVLILSNATQIEKMIFSFTKNWGMNPSITDNLQSVVSSNNKLNADIVILNCNKLEELEKGLVQVQSLIDKSKTSVIVLSQLGKNIDSSNIGVTIPFRTLFKPLKRKQLHTAILQLVKSRFPSEIVEASNKPVEEKQTHQLKVLLAEDNAINQMVASRMLSKLGYKPDIAANGREAVDACANTRYDLIFMDILMPELDGLEATKIIKAASGESKTPVIIAMTANAMTGDREIYLQAGLDDYISKPVSMDGLQQLIDRWKENIFTDKERKIEIALQENLVFDFIKEEKITFIQDIRSKADIEFFIEMLEVYIKDIPRTIEKIRQSAIQRNFEHLRFYIHKLKGSTLTLGIEETSSACRELEEAALDNNISERTMYLINKLTEQSNVITEELILLKDKYQSLLSSK